LKERLLLLCERASELCIKDVDRKARSEIVGWIGAIIVQRDLFLPLSEELPSSSKGLPFERYVGGHVASHPPTIKSLLSPTRFGSIFGARVPPRLLSMRGVNVI
jgi:hypothetical protein